MGEGRGYASELTKLMEDILTTLKYTLKMSFNETDAFFLRFVSHLKFFSERVLLNNYDEVREKDDEDLFKLISNKYPVAYLGAAKVGEFLEQTREYKISQNELVYMTIHIERILEYQKD